MAHLLVRPAEELKASETGEQEHLFAVLTLWPLSLADCVIYGWSIEMSGRQMSIAIWAASSSTLAGLHRQQRLTSATNLGLAQSWRNAASPVGSERRAC